MDKIDFSFWISHHQGFVANFLSLLGGYMLARSSILIICGDEQMAVDVSVGVHACFSFWFAVCLLTLNCSCLLHPVNLWAVFSGVFLDTKQ